MNLSRSHDESHRWKVYFLVTAAHVILYVWSANSVGALRPTLILLRRHGKNRILKRNQRFPPEFGQRSYINVLYLSIVLCIEDFQVDQLGRCTVIHADVVAAKNRILKRNQWFSLEILHFGQRSYINVLYLSIVLSIEDFQLL